MHHTIELLERALKIKKAAQWSHDFNITRATITMAKKKGRLSPTLASVFAMELGADPIYWTAVAAAEAEPPGPLRDRLEQSLERQKTVLFRRSHDSKKDAIDLAKRSGFRQGNTTLGGCRRAPLRCRRPMRWHREERQPQRSQRPRAARVQ